MAIAENGATATQERAKSRAFTLGLPLTRTTTLTEQLRFLSYYRDSILDLACGREPPRVLNAFYLN